MTEAENKKSCRIDAVQVGEVTIDAISNVNEITLVAKMAFVNVESASKLGFMHKRVWSEATWKVLHDLLLSMELDALRDIYGEGATAGGQASLTTTSDGIPGL